MPWYVILDTNVNTRFSSWSLSVGSRTFSVKLSVNMLRSSPLWGCLSSARPRSVTVKMCEFVSLFVSRQPSLYSFNQKLRERKAWFKTRGLRSVPSPVRNSLTEYIWSSRFLSSRSDSSIRAWSKRDRSRTKERERKRQTERTREKRKTREKERTREKEMAEEQKPIKRTACSCCIA